MSDRTRPGTGTGRPPVSGWAVGFAVIAGCMMIMAGVFGALAGVTRTQ